MIHDSSTRYPSDLSDDQWRTIEPLIPLSRPIGAERVTSMRGVVNGILYRRRSRCSWRMLPHDFPHWRTIYGYFRRWKADGTWAQIETAMREEASCAVGADTTCKTNGTYGTKGNYPTAASRKGVRAGVRGAPCSVAGIANREDFREKFLRL